MTETSVDPLPRDLLEQRAWLARLASALVADPHAADDAAQQTWLQALRSRAPLRDGRAWLAAVLGNVVRERHRGEQRRARRERLAADAHAGTADPASDANERFETQRTVAAAVQALAEPFRTTVLLHHFEGMSLAAIARAQQVPPGTVRWRLHRAHELLREALAARCGPDWRRSVLALCTPLRRSAMLAPAVVPVLLALGVVAAAMLWITSAGPTAPPAHRSAVAAGPGGAQRDEPPADRAAASGADDGAATAQQPTTTPAVPDQTAMLRARIVDGDGAPLDGAMLRVVDAELGRVKAPAELLARFAPAAAAGADGRVALALRAPRELLALADLPPGELVAKATLLASAPSHADEKIELHVANGDDRDLGTIPLVATTAIEGRVVDAHGRPLGGARVCVLTPPFPRFCEQLAASGHAPSSTPAATTADGTGAFALDRVRAGPTIVWASKPGFTSAWRLLAPTPPRSHCEDLVLRVDPVTRQAMPTEEELVVAVVDERDAPVEGAQVWYRQRHANNASSSGSVRAGPTGRTTLPTWRFGTGEDSVVGLELTAISERPTLASVVVARPQLADGEIRIVLPPAAAFEVRASGEDGAALGEFTVVWCAEAPGFAKGTAAGARGVATLPAPPVGATLEVSAPGCAVRRVPFVPGVTASPLLVTLAPQRGITGIVTAAGRPVAGAFVSVLRCTQPVLLDGYRSAGARDGKWDARTGRDGRFRIDRADAGTLRLQVRSDGHASAVTDPHEYEPGRGWNDVAIELSIGGAIEGVVRDRAGLVMPRALVAVHDFHGDARTVFADAAGRFRFDHLRAGGHEVRLADRELDGSWSTTVGLRGVAAGSTPHADCEVKTGATTRFDLVSDRCRLSGLLLPTGFDPRAWRATLMRAHDGLPTCKGAVLGRDGAFALSSSATGAHDLRLDAPGGPLGNVSVFVRVELDAGDTVVDVPLALAPFRTRAAGATGTTEGGWAYLRQEDAQRRVLTYVHVDPATLDLATPLAPVGDNVLVEGNAAGGTRDVGRFAVAPR